MSDEIILTPNQRFLLGMEQISGCLYSNVIFFKANPQMEQALNANISNFNMIRTMTHVLYENTPKEEYEALYTINPNYKLFMIIL